MYRDPHTFSPPTAPALPLFSTASACNGCDICRRDCAFLAEYGNPGDIAAGYRRDADRWRAIAFECSLCGLCTALCPRNLDPPSMFLRFRREAVEKDGRELSEHRRLLKYEQLGTSNRYSFYTLPENCHTVFFPGCTLTGTRPDITLKILSYLKQKIGNTGIILDCCTKPSHDLGRQRHFNEQFDQIKTFLFKAQIQSVVMACPGCYKIFRSYAEKLTVTTVYEIMERYGMDDTRSFQGEVTLHDPCQVRFEKKIQHAVRRVIRSRGIDIAETACQKEKTFCCGEGGGAFCITPGFASAWREKQITEAGGRKIVSYCAGCVNTLSRKAETIHLLDLVFNPGKALSGKIRISKAPVTYLNRLYLKKRLKKIPAAVIKERGFQGK